LGQDISWKAPVSVPGRFGRDETASKLWRWLAELREIILVWEFLRLSRDPSETPRDPLRFGYFDQMHMVHEIADLTGETPTRTLNVFRGFFCTELDALRSDGDKKNALHTTRIIL
jgi:hypothetical protein